MKKINEMIDFKTVNVFNPYFLFSFIFLLVFLIYQLNWSVLTIPISGSVSFFLLLNIFLFIFLGFWFDRVRKDLSSKGRAIIFDSSYKKVYNYFLIFIVCGVLLEGIVLKGYPLFNSFGWGSIQYIDYGIPVFHVVLLTTSYFFSVLMFEKLIHNIKDKRFYGAILVTLIPFIITINRGMIVMLLLSYGCLYFQYKQLKITKKIFLMLVTAGIVFLYVFGLFGNYRINSDYQQDRKITDSSIIMDVGGATESFRKGLLPKEFFWTYTYVTSPLSNLQYNVNEHSKLKNHEKDNFVDFVKVMFLPDFLSKRLHPTAVNNYQVKEELNVGTAYYEVYPRYGWLGMYIYLFVISVVPFLYLFLLNRYAQESIAIGMALLCTIYSLLFFTNFLGYTGLIIQLMFPFIIVIWKRLNIGSRFLKFRMK